MRQLINQLNKLKSGNKEKEERLKELEDGKKGYFQQMLQLEEACKELKSKITGDAPAEIQKKVAGDKLALYE